MIRRAPLFPEVLLMLLAGGSAQHTNGVDQLDFRFGEECAIAGLVRLFPQFLKSTQKGGPNVKPEIRPEVCGTALPQTNLKRIPYE